MNSTFHGPSGARGFSLIEMVAAFLVFAIGIGVLMQILGSSMHNAQRSAEYTQAALWAQSLMDTVGVGQPVEEGQSQGRFDDAYSWQLDIQKVDPQDVEPPPPQAATPANSGDANGRAQPNSRSPLSSTAGNSGALQVSPVDLYQIDLTVLWGNSRRPHQAHFTTLRAANPQTDQGQNPMQSHLPSSRSQSAVSGAQG
ncbi:MAG: prepilin-type N-terminal cleavage/methylation domain-containing protein [Rhodanobacteraceae bacterium]